MTSPDATVVGSGPNGLTAAIALAEAGLSVRVVEGAATVGGGTRTEELTLPGFRHDVCAAVHPLGYLSPYWRTLPLERYGLRWIHPRLSVAHPLVGGTAVTLSKSIDETAARLGRDGPAWRKLVGPFLRGNVDRLLADLLSPLGVPQRPITMARFGMRGVTPASTLASLRFETVEAKALFAGLAAHSMLRLDAAFSGAVGLLFAISAHLVNWPVAEGGSVAVADALAAHLRSLGGEIETGRWVRTLDDLPSSGLVLFDTSPRAMASILGGSLRSGYRRALRGFDYGPAAFKLDFALDGPIPWTASECAEASTVHVGGTLPEIAASERLVWHRRPPRAPFLIVCQQSSLDSGRAPAGKHTGYAYCHVPQGFDGDASGAIEAQIERFAPGFRDRILARRAWTPADLEAHDPNYVGGAISGGVPTWNQLFTRPVARWSPYTTPNPRFFLCSSSTPPGAGVHGMCGFHAAQAALGSLGMRRRRLPDRRRLLT